MYYSPDGVVTLGHQLSAKSARVRRTGLNPKSSHDLTRTKPLYTWNNNLTRNLRHSHI